jgi:WD40 repeat protein
MITLQKTVSLVSTSTDGKILVWRYQDKLRYPIKGHSLLHKIGAESLVIGGTSLDKVNQMEDNTYLVGTEGGSIFKCSVGQPSDTDIAHLFENSSLRWKTEAQQVIANLPKKSMAEVKKRVERYAQDRGDREIQVETVFNAKPDIKVLYPSTITSNFERHAGLVTGCHCSPFNKRLFLTCSVDGSVRIFDMHVNKPVAVFEPSCAEYLMNAVWSPYRPTVFVCISNNGNVYIYDLLLSKEVPSYTLPYSQSLLLSDRAPSAKTAYSLAFNPRQRDFLAVGYHDGTAKIFQLNYSLSTQKNDEIRHLKSLFLEKERQE